MVNRRGSACRKLESAQMKMDRRLWGAKSSRSGSAGRSKVEEAGGKEGRDEGGVW